MPSFPQASAGISLFGVAGLSFLAGAALIYFQLPPYEFLDQAIRGAKAWHERGRAENLIASGIMADGVTIDSPSQTYDGFTLVTTVKGSRAKLVDMRGNLVHQWEKSFREVWRNPPHVSTPLPENQIHWFRSFLYPNGDLLAVYHADGDTPYGYGLVKLDKESNVLWSYAANCHHDIDLDENGTIYTLGQDLVHTPPAGLEGIAGPLIADSIVMLSPYGKKVDEIPLLDAFANSPFALLVVASLGNQARGPVSSQDGKGDVLHANSVKVLSPALAPRFPLFKAGQVLVSLRSGSLLAVVDTHSRSVVWAARGIWLAQHDAEFLSNGHLLIYDNCGGGRTRIVEYDPVTQAVPWVYTSESGIPFRVESRGMKQSLPNGNLLIVDPEHWMVRETNRDQEVVWECSCGAIVTGARRYSPDELPFLRGGANARP